MAKLVAEEFCVPFEKVGISPADTRSTGYDVCTHATRGVYCGSDAALQVAREAKRFFLITQQGLWIHIPRLLS